MDYQEYITQKSVVKAQCRPKQMSHILYAHFVDEHIFTAGIGETDWCFVEQEI